MGGYHISITEVALKGDFLGSVVAFGVNNYELPKKSYSKRTRFAYFMAFFVAFWPINKVNRN